MKINDITLASCAMLVEFNASCWTARKLDRKVTGEVTSNKQANSDSARVNKNLLSGRGELEEITKLITKVRNYEYDNTLPWSKGGQQLLPSTKFLTFDAQMGTFKEEFDTVVASFVTIYPTLITAQAMALGQMFSRDDYPPAGDIARRFAFAYDYLPVPVAGDFRVDVGMANAEKLRARLEQVATSRVEQALGDLKKRLGEHLRRMSERLVTDIDPATGEPKHRKFTSTLVSSAYDLCDLVKGLNVTGDPELKEACAVLENVLAGTSAEGLRTDAIKRADVKKEVDRLLGAFDFTIEDGA